MPWNASSKPGTRLGSYKGLTSEVWGCYVYFEITAAAHRSQNRGERPITLCRDNGLTSGWCSDARFSWDRKQDWSGRWCNHTDAGADTQPTDDPGQHIEALAGATRAPQAENLRR